MSKNLRMPPYKKVVYMTNQRVAWAMTGSIGFRYDYRYYLPPEGWEIITKVHENAPVGVCGEIRLQREETHV